MANALIDLIEKINDETSFLAFFRALRENCEAAERDCPPYPHDCASQEHFESRSTKDFLRSAEEWASGGDFAEGVHHGEPMLRRVACMLFAGKYRPRD